MVLIILAVSLLAAAISCMALVKSVIEPLAWRTSLATSCIKALAWLALFTFCLVMEDISSMEEEVSSKEAACSEAASARDWEVAILVRSIFDKFSTMLAMALISSPVSSLLCTLISMLSLRRLSFGKHLRLHSGGG